LELAWPQAAAKAKLQRTAAATLTIDFTVISYTSG